MKKQFEILRTTRAFLLSLLDLLSSEQLNKIPAGFNNNVIWNVAHMVAAQQGVCYVRAGLPLVIEDAFFQNYKPDTHPAAALSETQITEIKKLLFSTIDTLEMDYNEGLFNANPAWTNRYGVEHENIEQSITFLLFHDGLHIGYIMAMRKLL